MSDDYVTNEDSLIDLYEAGDALSPCRSGCKTKDHASYAECLREARLQIGNLK